MSDPILENLARAANEKQATRISRRLQAIASRVERELKSVSLPGESTPVFGLFVFVSGSAQYIGNGHRGDIKTVVASILSRWDDPDLHKPYHEKTAEELAAEEKDAI